MEIKVGYDKNKKMGILESDFLENIREHFSVKDSEAHIKQMYNRFIPSRKYSITNTGRFGVGLFAEIYEYIKRLSIPFSLSITDDFKKHFKPSYKLQNTRISALKLDLRDYQTESIRKCISHGNGVLKLATGAGKTLLMAALVKTLHDNIHNHFTVIVVPSVQLVEQTYKDFVDYGFDPNLISRVSGEHDIRLGVPILICNAQFLLVSKNIPNLIFNADLLIIDEVHGLRRDNQLNKIIKKFGTFHKFGFTGTLPESNLDIWNIIGKIGPLIYEKSSASLRTEGYLADVEAQILRVFYQDSPKYSIPSISEPLVAYNEELQWLQVSPFRNRLLAKIATRTTNNTLIVVDRLDHGRIIKTRIEELSSNKQVFFIQGSTELDDREKIRELMEKENNIIVIAISKIFATGINIKNLHYIILAVSGKAKIRLLQSIGRGLRLQEQKDRLYILDISDQLKYGKEHEEKRIEIYKEDQIRYVIRDIFEKEIETSTT